mmetsp:Transcript_21131/g.66813  ORF Transcript_21131/g.66813 Transcript_21131/m.66813 type:complete len:284 (-) Transcript_21131:477-1328(-)
MACACCVLVVGIRVILVASRRGHPGGALPSSPRPAGNGELRLPEAPGSTRQSRGTPAAGARKWTHRNWYANDSGNLGRALCGGRSRERDPNGLGGLAAPLKVAIRSGVRSTMRGAGPRGRCGVHLCAGLLADATAAPEETRSLAVVVEGEASANLHKQTTWRSPLVICVNQLHGEIHGAQRPLLEVALHRGRGLHGLAVARPTVQGSYVEVLKHQDPQAGIPPELSSPSAQVTQEVADCPEAAGSGAFVAGPRPRIKCERGAQLFRDGPLEALPALSMLRPLP